MIVHGLKLVGMDHERETEAEFYVTAHPTGRGDRRTPFVAELRKIVPTYALLEDGSEFKVCTSDFAAGRWFGRTPEFVRDAAEKHAAREGIVLRSDPLAPVGAAFHGPVCGPGEGECQGCGEPGPDECVGCFNERWTVACIGCGGQIETPLARLGSIRCQDCRDGIGAINDFLRRAA